MRLLVIVLVVCFVLFVFAEGKSSKSSGSKGSKGSASEISGKGGKVTKHKNKPSHGHHRDSSDSSEESSHSKGKLKKHNHGDSGKNQYDDSLFKKHESGSKPTKFNDSTIHHEHNSTRHTLKVPKNNTYALSKNVTSPHASFKNSTKLTNNVTTLGVALPGNSSGNKLNISEHELKKHFPSNDDDYKPGLNRNSSILLATEPNSNSTARPLYGWKNHTTDQIRHGSKNHTMDQSPHGSKNHTMDQLPFGWKNNTMDQLPYGWNNKTAAIDPPTYGWVYQTPLQGQNLRKDFAIPEISGNQKTYYSNPGFTTFNQAGPNSIAGNGHSSSHPVGFNFQPNVVSNIAPAYGWDVQNPAPAYNNYYNNGPAEKAFPIYNTYDKKDSSKFLKGTKKAFKKVVKSVGKGLSDDEMKDKIKEVASSYFSNPPPSGWVYAPPYNTAKINYFGNNYGRLSPGEIDKLSISDWKNIIFRNSPLKVDTRPLYSASFPETGHNLNLSPFSGQGNFPDLGQSSYKRYFTPPHYQKLFAGLLNDDTAHGPIRERRDLSPKGKILADSINKFLSKERDCNDTDLTAKRRKRQLVIKPILGESKKKYGSKIENFQFTDVEAIVHSDGEYSVYGGVPEILPVEGTLRPKTEGTTWPTNSDLRGNYASDIKITVNTDFTSSTPPSTSSGLPHVKNRTRLFPVSESIAQFLKRKPVTQLTAVKECDLEQWKAFGKSVNNTSFENPQGKEQKIEDNSSEVVTVYDRVADKGFTTDKKVRLGVKNFSDSGISMGNSFDYSTEKYDGSSSYLDRKDNSPFESLVFKGRDSKTEDAFSEGHTERKYEWLSEMIENTVEHNQKMQPLRNGFYFFGIYIPNKTDDLRMNVENERSEGSSDLTGIDDKASLESPRESFSELSFVPEVDNDFELTPGGYPLSAERGGTDKSSVRTTGENIEVNYDLEGETRSEIYSETAATNDEQQMTSESDSSPDVSTYAKTGWPYLDVPSTSISNPTAFHDAVFRRGLLQNDPLNERTPMFRVRAPNSTGETFSDRPVLISAPLRKVVCGPNERPVKGRCRRVW